jgi:acetate kinase
VNILVVNAGSSTLKLSVIGDADEVVSSRQITTAGGKADRAALSEALAGLGHIDAVGHRIVHGGRWFHGPVRVTDDVAKRLRELADLAPLHQPKSLDALRAASAALPRAPAVACFDTAFHSHLPEAAATYALPSEWRERFEIRRYGFHGLSHAYVARRAPELLDRSPRKARIVSCHLGAGASLTAIDGGRSIDTTMGFTPLEGLVMATRSGTVDPGLLLWLLEHTGITEREMANALEHESGLVGLAGTADMPAILATAGEGDKRARLALDVYVHRLRSGIAAMAAAMDGLDALAFTGGVGENAPEIRAAAAGRLGFLGVEIDDERNVAATEDADVSDLGASVRTLVIAAREDLEIARQVREVLDPK